METNSVTPVEPTVSFTVKKLLQILEDFTTATPKQRETTMNFIRGFQPATKAVTPPVVTQREPKAPKTLVHTQKAYLKSKDVALLMGVTRWRVLQLVKETRGGHGNFPYYRVGIRSYRFVWQEVEAWMAQNKR